MLNCIDNYVLILDNKTYTVEHNNQDLLMKIDVRIVAALLIGVIFAMSCKSKDIQKDGITAVNESERDTIVIENEELEYELFSPKILGGAW